MLILAIQCPTVRIHSCERNFSHVKRNILILRSNTNNTKAYLLERRLSQATFKGKKIKTIYQKGKLERSGLCSPQYRSWPCSVSLVHKLDQDTKSNRQLWVHNPWCHYENSKIKERIVSCLQDISSQKWELDLSQQSVLYIILWDWVVLMESWHIHT